MIRGVLNEGWSADFMADALWSSRRFRTFNVMDDFNHEVVRIEIDTNLPTRLIVRILDELVEPRDTPLKSLCMYKPVEIATNLR